MLWTDDDKLIYSIPGTDLKYDPLRIERGLTVASQGKLGDWQRLRNDGTDAEAAWADLQVADAGRKAFRFGEDVTDAMVVKAVDDFLGWLAKKGTTAATSPTSPPCTDCPKVG